MSTYVSTTAAVWCRVEGGGDPVLAKPGQSFLFGSGAALWGCYPQDEVPESLMWDVCGGGDAVPMTAKEFLAHKEYKLLCGFSGVPNPEAREKAIHEAQEWVSALEYAIAIGYKGALPSSVAEFRQWLAQWEANGRPCQCGGGAAVAMCPEASPYCG